jgi:hypothetical protein
MAFNSSQMIPQLRKDFERLLAFVTGPQAEAVTMDQMERSRAVQFCLTPR